MPVQRGEIYYAELDPVVGSEQGGFRPVLIVQNDTGNKFSPTTIVAALTSKTDKARIPTHVITTETGLPTLILLEQVRTLDKSRLREYICNASEKEMEQVDEAIKISFGLESSNQSNGG